MPVLAWCTVQTPVGIAVAVAQNDALVSLSLHSSRPRADSWRACREIGAAADSAAEPFSRLTAQLAEYFARARRRFSVPLAPQGTPFQREVWGALQSIPYGTTVTYDELARRIGRPRGSRAVGQANGRNPIAVLIPCHRVIGAGGSLTGYGAGIAAKRTLLELEGVIEAQPGLF